MKTRLILALIFILFILGCYGTSPEEIQEAVGGAEAINNWKDTELKDIATGEMFKFSDFDGQVVLLESFAVWCPTCKRQQDKIKELHEEIEIISVSLDTDPNEDESKVLGHINRYGYDWRFAVAPIEMTQALIDEFSIGIVNAPGAPVVLICEDGSSKLLQRGVKSAAELKEEIERC